eukprot:12160450-Ditylum_brightwellii.AAC.1
MFGCVVIVSQLSASKDVLNWQLKMGVAKTWMMAGAFTMMPLSTRLSSANWTLIPVVDAVHVTGIALRMTCWVLTLLSLPPMVLEYWSSLAVNAPPTICMGGGENVAATAAV